MTGEFLLDAIGQMDDALVLEASTPIHRTIPWAKVSGWAAALLLCVGVASLPGSMPKTSSGSAAPESNFILGDMIMDQDSKTDGFEYRSEQEAQDQAPFATIKTESATTGTVSSGVVEPRFFTQRGVYLLIGEDPYTPKLPDENEVTALGTLVAAVPGEQLYPSTGTQELVYCPVWESKDGYTLYIQLKDGGYLIARLYT